MCCESLRAGGAELLCSLRQPPQCRGGQHGARAGPGDPTCTRRLVRACSRGVGPAPVLSPLPLQELIGPTLGAKQGFGFFPPFRSLIGSVQGWFVTWMPVCSRNAP